MSRTATGLTGIPKNDPLGVQPGDGTLVLPKPPESKKTLVDLIETGFSRLKVSEEDEAAGKMAIDQFIRGLEFSRASKLASAIEKAHGARTASVIEEKAKGGLFAVGRVSPRPERKRKAKTTPEAPAKTEESGNA